MELTHKARIALSTCIIGFAAISATHGVSYARLHNAEGLSNSKTAEVTVKKEKTGFLSFAGLLFSTQNHPVPSLKPDFDNRTELSMADQERYKAIFALQAAGNINEADKNINKIKNKALMGHVLYQRYMHPTAYKSSFEELAAWMALYHDHPNASDIYSLAERKMPEGYNGTIVQASTGKKLARAPEPGMTRGKTYKSNMARSSQEQQIVNQLFNDAKRGDIHDVLVAVNEAEEAMLVDAIEKDALQAKLAERLMYRGEFDQAAALAVESADRSGDMVPIAGWVAGLTHWNKGEFEIAAKYFEMTATSDYASGWKSAAGAFWAARAHMRARNVSEVSTWLKKAEEHPRTFYGLLATRALGRDFSFDWSEPTFTKKHFALLSRTAEGRRAMALVSFGQTHRAEKELMVVEPENKAMREALLAYAFYADLPALSMRLGALHRGEKGKLYDAALYPVGPWTPQEGYNVDPALLHAIMRQESRFDPSAESHSGARGLMQLMPTTATYVSGVNSYKSSSGVHLLEDPETNIDIGQRYVKKLLNSKQIKDDMLAMLMAYNAGPGNLQRWQSSLAQVNDPLLFIELIPIAETRNYVERVLSNYWIYRDRDGLDTPSLDALAAGRIARYAGMPGEVELALAQ